MNKPFVQQRVKAKAKAKKEDEISGMKSKA